MDAGCFGNAVMHQDHAAQVDPVDLQMLDAWGLLTQDQQPHQHCW